MFYNKYLVLIRIQKDKTHLDMGENSLEQYVLKAATLRMSNEYKLIPFLIHNIPKIIVRVC